MNDQQQPNLRKGEENGDPLNNIRNTPANPSNARDNDDTSAVNFGDSTLQSPEEFKQDKLGDHSEEDNKVTSSGIDDLQSNSDGAAGTDRAGTTERKPYGDPELNKGLESQAMDLES